MTTAEVEPTEAQMAAFRVALIAMSHACQDMRAALDTMGAALKDMAECMAWINKRTELCQKERPPSGNSHAPWWCKTHNSPIAVIAERCLAVVEAG